ncbi:MAG: hypothetical protein J2P31_07555 [Blastocatellia bacterium]|nr:hypothetical protein [Blastocatellia bacterium]
MISEEVFSESQTNSDREDRTNYYLGVDGGGTNCRAVIVDEAGCVRGEGRAEAGNFHRVGLEVAIAHIESAVAEACRQAGIAPRQITAACLGLAGVSHPKHHNRMLAALKAGLPITDITLETDARVALAGATGNRPGIVIIAGTGSIACGINARGRFARAGGWGPTMGDEGSGAYIGRRALEAILMAYDYRGEPTMMLEPVLRYFGVSSPPELPSVIYDSPAEVQSRIAQLSRIVVKAAQEGDKVARSILKDAAEELAKAAIAVIEQLKMEKDSFTVAYVGGVFESGELILTTLREEIKKVAPNAEIAPPLNPPVIGAVKMALEKKVDNR